MAAQLPDKVLVEGEQWDLYSNPLEQYWIRQFKKRPDFYPLPNCKRGYIALWEIRNNQLSLKSIDGNFEKRSLFFGPEQARYSLKEFMPKAKNKPILATWFSGKLRIPKGKMTLYEHQDYGSRFEKETIITVEKGNVTKAVTIDYTKSVLVVEAV
jgi:hypothetical protein